jgi:hypothetical protein
MYKTVHLVYNEFGEEQILSTHLRKGRTVGKRAGGPKRLGWTYAAAAEAMAKTMAVVSKNFILRVMTC